MNNVMICGSIGEPRFRDVNTKTGVREVCSFGICQIEGRDANNNPIFSWYNAEYWMNKDSKLKPLLVKGTKVLAVGELKTEKWSKDGEEKSTIKIVVRTLELVGSKQEQTQVTTTPIVAGEPQSDDLPF